MPDAYYLQTLGITLRDAFRRMVDTPEAVEAMVKTYVAYNMDHHDAKVRAYRGVPETLHELKRRGARLGIVTSKMREHALRGLACCGARRGLRCRDRRRMT